MLQLLKTEWLKLKGYKTFWIIVAAYAVLMAITLFSLESFKLNTGSTAQPGMQVDFKSLGLFSFPDVWQNLTYVAGFFKFLLAILIVVIISNEYEFKTIRQNLIDGWSRKQFYTAKFLLIVALALGATLLVMCLTVVLGVPNTYHITPLVFFTRSQFLIWFFIELFGFLSFVMLVTLLIRRAAFAIGIYLMYAVIIEPLLALRFDNLAPFLPLESFSNLIPLPFVKIIGQSVQTSIPFSSIVIALGFIVVFQFLSYKLIQTRDF
ncbi:MAG: hypothetical protein RIQ89_2178 [Bacteroidota bacterium]|jgi:hypothetical protein